MLYQAAQLDPPPKHANLPFTPHALQALCSALQVAALSDGGACERRPAPLAPAALGADSDGGADLNSTGGADSDSSADCDEGTLLGYTLALEGGQEGLASWALPPGSTPFGRLWRVVVVLLPSSSHPTASTPPCHPLV
jgi:hypothetical protein